MYEWRKLTEVQQQELLKTRKQKNYPWHSPPHNLEPGTHHYILSAACYEHKAIIGKDAQRMDQLIDELAQTIWPLCDKVFAWCLLPNHYHLIFETQSIAELLRKIGQLHGRTSHLWNGQEGLRGRQVWHGAVEREIRSERHLWASINYVHHNPVKHGYVRQWQDWPWSSAQDYIDELGREKAKEIWEAYPIMDYGRGWDE